MNGQSLSQQTFVVTGANSGIGRAMAARLGAQGATVLMVCRNRQKAEEAQAALRREAPRGRFELVLCDLAELSGVRRAAEELLRLAPRLDGLVNNAGLYLPRRHLTSEGLETMFAVNHLAPFLLTHLLGEALASAQGGRVVTVTSFGHRLGHVNFENLQAERSFLGLRQYCNTKLYNVLFTRELARRWTARGVVAHSFSPGAVATGFAFDEKSLFSVGVALSRPFQRSPARAARLGTYLCTSDDALRSSGDYWSGRSRTKPSREARRDEVALRLWDVSAKLCGLP